MLTKPKQPGRLLYDPQTLEPGVCENHCAACGRFGQWPVTRAGPGIISDPFLGDKLRQVWIFVASCIHCHRGRTWQVALEPPTDAEDVRRRWDSEWVGTETEPPKE